MPNIKDINTIKAIAREYCSNGRDKAKSLLSVGYKQTYAYHKSCYLFQNKDLIDEINRFENERTSKTRFTVEKAEREYEEARVLALQLNQPSAAVSATTGKARLYGMDKDVGISYDNKPEPLTEAEIEALKDQAKALTMPKLRTA